MATKAQQRALIADLEARVACYKRVALRPESPLRRVDATGKDYGLYIPELSPVTVERLEIFGATRDNIRAMPWHGDGKGAVAAQAATLRSLLLHDAALNTPLDDIYGRWGSNLWLGRPGEVRQVEARFGHWMNFWFGGQTADPKGGCFGAQAEHLYATNSQIGVYVEQCTRETTFDVAWIEATDRGFVVEWCDPNGGKWWQPNRSRDLLIKGQFIDMRGWQPTWWRAGYAFDFGHYVPRITVKDCVVIGGKGILVGKGETADTLKLDNVTDGNGNDVPVTTY